MSGHSKWSSIKHKKGAADAKRGQLFTKLTRALIVAAKDGGPDPAANLALQNAIDKARAASMPKDNIERAIARGAGTGADAANYEHISYEGYAPGGVAVYVEVLTDNRNRTAGEVRHVFARADGNLAESGAVAWLFERKGVILVDGSADEDELTLAAADAGAEDVVREGSSFEVTCAPEDLRGVREALEAAGDRDLGGGGDDAAEDDRLDRGRDDRAEGAEADRLARGAGRRAGRLRELRHSRARSRDSRRLARCDDARTWRFQVSPATPPRPSLSVIRNRYLPDRATLNGPTRTLPALGEKVNA